MLHKRLAAGLALVALIVGAMACDQQWEGAPVFLPLLLAFAIPAGREVGRLLPFAPPRQWVVDLGLVSIIALNWWGRWPGGVPLLPPPLALIPPFLGLVGWWMIAAALEVAQFRRPERAIATLSSTLLALLYIGGLGSFFAQERWLPGGVWVIAFHLVAVKGADTGAYTIGRMFGRRKMVPALSPGKTWEGAIGGLVFAVLLPLLLLSLVPSTGSLPSQTGIALYGLALGVAGQVGDLVESLMKREAAQKDASQVLPGLGGVLDVLDSVLYSAPLSYSLWWLLTSTREGLS